MYTFKLANNQCSKNPLAFQHWVIYELTPWFSRCSISRPLMMSNPDDFAQFKASNVYASPTCIVLFYTGAMDGEIPFRQ